MRSARRELNRLRMAAQGASATQRVVEPDVVAITPDDNLDAEPPCDVMSDDASIPPARYASGLRRFSGQPVALRPQPPSLRATTRATREPPERVEWRRWAQAILAADDAWMIVDTETTGTHREADIIEFAAVTPSGKVLADCLIRPRQPIPPFITALTGITNAMVSHAPRFPFAYAEALLPHLTTRGILAYNAPFDIRMLRQNIQRHCRRAWEPVDSACLMRAYGKWRGECYPPGHGWAGRVMVHRLDVACGHLGIPHDHAHRALDDCLVTAKLLQTMARM